MLFELPHDTECELTAFVGRTQKSGRDDVPAVSFRLQLTSVQNTMLDMFSKTMRLTVYAPIEGQEQLPGIELTTPILRSKDLKHWAPETRLEGWKLIVARGITDEDSLPMGKCKLDDFKFDFHDGGFMDFDFRVSTADIDEEGAGMLWGRQKRKVFVTVIAPEIPAPAIDGTVAAFKSDHPDPDDDGPDAGDLFAEEHGHGIQNLNAGREDGEQDEDHADEPEQLEPGADEPETEEALAQDASLPVEAWPFPQKTAPAAKTSRRTRKATAEAAQ